MRTLATYCMILLAGSLCLAGHPEGPPAEVKAQFALPLFLKIISYDESFTAKSNCDTVQLFVLYDFANSASYRQYQDAEEYFKEAGTVTVSGVPVKLIGVESKTADSVLAKRNYKSYLVIICTTEMGPAISELVSRWRESRYHSFSLDPADLSGGVAVSVIVEPKKTSIAVNLRAAKAEGSRFSARLLSMCTIVEPAS